MTGKPPERIVRRPVSGRGLPFTGERFVPSISGEIEIEHIHRYLFAVPLVCGLDVLDIASGEGYGSAILAQEARSVLGVDIDPDSVEHASATYATKNIAFRAGSCDAIPAADASFDVVVSFETIEHVEGQERFLDEVRRVLRPGGLFVCSTPDPARYRVGSPPNPFHRRELSRNEFETLIATRFLHRQTLGQKLVSGSVIGCLEDASGLDVVATGDGKEYQRGTLADRAVYLILLASDQPVEPRATSLLTDQRYSVGKVTALREKVAEIAGLRGQLNDTVGQAVRLPADLDGLEAAKTGAIDWEAVVRAFERTVGEQRASQARWEAEAAAYQTRLEAAGEELDSVRQALGDASTSLSVARAIAREGERLRGELSAAQSELREALTLMEARARHAESAASDQTLEIQWMRSTRSWRWTGWLRRGSGGARATGARAAGLTARCMTRLGLPGAERAAVARRAALFRASRLFDGGYYLARYPDVAAAGLDPAWHYAARGAGEGRDPSPWFSTRAYLDLHSDVTAARMNPLEHYLVRGQAEGRAIVAPSVLTSERAVYTPRPVCEPMGPAMLAELFRASAFLDAEGYLRRYPDVAAAGCDPARHYAVQGVAEGRNPSEQFDTAFYRASMPAECLGGMHPLEHFLLVGQAEGRAPRAGGSRTPTAPSGRIEVRERYMPPCIETDKAQLARTKAIAFYLPQYHPIPENDAWWGKGFTEWTNVTRARAMFPGHAQPMLPGELGFYDLRLPEVRERQAVLARAAGIHGFCYHHYWFNGRRVLERPLDEVLRLGEPDFPFCLCWANENWTRRWDGLEKEILLQQRHTLASDRRFILDLLPYLKDDRYIRVDGRPVIVVYRADLMVDAADTAAVWRDECARAGLGEIHLCAVQFRTGDPRPLGFDAAVEFPPHHFPAPEITARVEGLDPTFGGSVFDYAAGVRELIDRPRKADYRLYRGVMPSWDNTARRMEQAAIRHGATPEIYEAWLRSAINHRQPEDGISDNLVFINAWNEWAEGTVLEPRRDLGDAYLRATARALGVEAPLAGHGSAELVPALAPMSDQPKLQGSLPPRPSLEERLKRVVRTNRTLNSFVNRHPVLKSRAASFARRMTAAADQSHELSAPTDTPRRALPLGRLWHPGPDEAVTEDARSLLIVSHDACLAGAQIVVLELLRHFANDPSIRVYHLICGSGALEPEMRRLATTCCLDDLTRRGASRAAAISEALDALPRIDLALCNTAATADALRACAKRDMQTISYIHELPTTIDTMLGGEKTMRIIARHAGRIVVVSRFVRDRLAESYNIPAERLEVVHMGTFPSKAGSIDRLAAAMALRAEIGVDPETRVVLGCGTIHHRKGTDLWVAAAARCIRTAREADRPEPIFVWVGWDQSGTDLRLWCEHHARSAGIADRVRFIGAREDTRPYFAGADVFALSSREDPFPLVSLEAMVCGTPVVAFEGAGGAPEALLIPGSAAGLTVPFGDASAMGDAIASLLDDPALAGRLSQGGQEVTRGRLRWDRYIRSLLDGESAEVLADPQARGENQSDPIHAPAADRTNTIAPDQPRLLVVSHDGCLGGSQLILLENIRHWIRNDIDCRAVLLRGGAQTGDFEALCPTTRLDQARDHAGPESADRLATILDEWAAEGWTPDAAFCNTVASSPAMQPLTKRAVPIVSSLYELPTTINSTLGGSQVMARVAEASERIIVASGFVRDRLTEAYGLDAVRLQPIHTGVLARRLPDRNRARAAVRRELGVPTDAFVVLGCGSIHHRKGTDLFIHAAAETRRAEPGRPIVFAWVGENQSGPTFRNWCLHDAQRLGVADAVRFVGGRDDPAPWFAGADAFALTSREDPFPMVCLEALAAGLGVVTFNGAGGAPEALLDPAGDRGLVVPYMDTAAMGRALAELATDPNRLTVLRGRALAFAEEHLGWDRYMEEINDLLASCSPRFRREAPLPIEART